MADSYRKSTASQPGGNCIEVGETDYRKASYSNPSGCCIEVGTARTSSFSSYNGNCIEAAQATAGIGVRDTKQAGQRDRTEIEFTAAAWRTFLAGLKE